MKIFCLTLILILSFCAVSSAQTNENLKCPAISVNGPPTLVRPGETGVFTAIVGGENAERYIYIWTITVADIIEDDGKKIINLGKTVEAVGKTFIKFQIPPEIAGASPTATVEVKGLPQGCETTASETLGTWCPPEIIHIDDFSISPNQIDKSKLNNLAEHLENNPSAQIYIIERFVKKTSPQAIKRKHQKMIDYLNSIGMDVSRITFIYGYANKNQIQIFLVPAGASAPTCDDCITIEPK